MGDNGWHPIATAPKDAPYLDVWMSGPEGEYRVPNVRWTKYVNASRHNDLQEREGWCHEDSDGIWLDIEHDEMVVTHWRLPPEGPE